jgi:hypothetical protein
MKTTARPQSTSSKSLAGSAAGTAVPSPAPTGQQFSLGLPLGTAQALMGLAAFSLKQKLR